MTDWFANEDFWRDVYPFMFRESRLTEPTKQLANLMALADPPGNDILDLCCGPGRWSVALAGRGLNVTGVDSSAFLLDRARERAAEAAVAVDFVACDMREFTRPEAFDLAVSMFTSFGYFADKNDDLVVLRNLHASLRSGGVCVLEVIGKEYLARRFQPTIAEELPDGSTLVQRRAVVDDWTRIRNHWILLRNDGVRSYTFELTVYSGQELRDRLERVGFTEVILYGDLAGAPYGLESERLVAVARKS